MTKPTDFEEAIKKRLESLGTKRKEVLRIRRSPDKPVETSESSECIDKDIASEKAQKAKRKRMNGYNNKQGGRRG